MALPPLALMSAMTRSASTSALPTAVDTRTCSSIRGLDGISPIGECFIELTANTFTLTHALQ
jgi:hypothetical protein